MTELSFSGQNTSYDVCYITSNFTVGTLQPNEVSVLYDAKGSQVQGAEYRYPKIKAIISKDGYNISTDTSVFSLEQSDNVLSIKNNSKEARSIYLIILYDGKEYLDYFVASGLLGWVKFYKDFWKSLDRSSSFYATPFPVDVFDYYSNETSQQRVVDLAFEKTTGNFVYYNEYAVTPLSENRLYGIYNSEIENYGDIAQKAYIKSGTKVVSVISPALFDKNYYSLNLDKDEVQYSVYYNVKEAVNLLIVCDGGVPTDKFITVDKDATGAYTKQYKELSYYGYTPAASTLISVYRHKEDSFPSEYILRNYPPYGYWTDDKSFIVGWSHKWNSYPSDTFVKTGGSVYLYRGNAKVSFDKFDLYVLNPSDLEAEVAECYVFNDGSISNIYKDGGIIEATYGFYHISNNLYGAGITPYLCRIIPYDDNGNSMLDPVTGLALVWQDPETDKYWNGLNGLNIWQDEKPYIEM